VSHREQVGHRSIHQEEERVGVGQRSNLPQAGEESSILHLAEQEENSGCHSSTFRPVVLHNRHQVGRAGVAEEAFPQLPNSQLEHLRYGQPLYEFLERIGED